MLKLIVLGLMAIILTAGSLVFKFVVYDPENNSTVGAIFGTFDLLKDFIAIFMLLWYVLK